MRVKNVWSPATFVGQYLATDQEYDIPQNELHKWQGDDFTLQSIAAQNLLVGDGITYKSTSSEALHLLLGVDARPKDLSGRQLVRPTATIEGWHYQLLSTEITTGKIGGYYSKDDSGNDLGIVTHKIYDVNGAEITDPANEGNAVKTVVFIRPQHSYEILGAIFSQNVAPNSDIRLFSTGVPGIYNVKFANGGINLKHIGQGTFPIADGRASKYMAYVAQVPDANSFKITLLHGAGVQHSFMLSFETYKAV